MCLEQLELSFTHAYRDVYSCTIRLRSYSVPSLNAANVSAGGKNVVFFGPVVSPLTRYKFQSTCTIYVSKHLLNLLFKVSLQFTLNHLPIRLGLQLPWNNRMGH